MNLADAQETDQCLVCRCSALTTLYPSTYSGSVGEAADYFLAHRKATVHGRIVKCGSCGFVFTSPRYSGEDYDRIYATVSKPSAAGSAFEEANAARFARLASIVRQFQPPNASFLDFGCGDAGFLRHVGSNTGIGFETGPPGRRRTGQSEIITGSWSSLAGSMAFPASTFDHVVAFDVLEHLPRIEQDLGLIRLVLKPKGLLFASVPNVKSAVARVMGRRWNMILLEHLWYFSPITFQSFMAKQGFELIKIRRLPYDAPLSHITTRLAQTFGMRGTLTPSVLSRIVFPVPAGIMLGVFRRAD
jgi:SAM-dependent methyltransferase